MSVHRQQQFSPYSPQQIFDLVADVARYPEFLPWCRAARILTRGENEFTAELVISFKHMTERYTSRVELVPHSMITATMTHGPFHHLLNRWEFSEAPGGGTEINLLLDFKFKSMILEKLIGPLFATASTRMAKAFSDRADALYGPVKPATSGN